MKEQALNRQINVEFRAGRRHPERVHWFRLLLPLLLAPGLILSAEPATARIIKVLPHLIDHEGRHTLSPSLYERDAYQALLRHDPEKCAGLRFDVQWKAKGAARLPLLLRVEIRGSKDAKPFILERRVQPNHWYSRWSSVTLDGASYQKTGQVIAWRTTLWGNDTLLGEQKSFLW